MDQDTYITPQELKFEGTFELTEEGKRVLLTAFGVTQTAHTYQNPDGSYTHEFRFQYPQDEFPQEIDD